MSSPIDISLSATNLSNHLACPHLTTLDLAVKRGQLEKPDWHSPDLAVIQELGRRHEAAYIDHLKKQKLNICDLSAIGDRTAKERTTALEKTRQALHEGVDVILQAALGNSLWYGRADVLRKVPYTGDKTTNKLGTWSYEPYDCKLALETKGETILQLAVYSELLSEIQGHDPKNMYVVTPGRSFDDPEHYPYAEYSAYYQLVKDNLEKIAATPSSAESPAPSAAAPLTPDNFVNGTYPEPCAHCDICRWFRECDAQRRKDDHLSLVAGISRLQRDQLRDWHISTMTQLSAMPIRPMQHKPDRGSRESYERIREQARLQVTSINLKPALHEFILPIVADTGFCLLPEPSPYDVFLDLEGDPYAPNGGLQYLFGFAALPEDAASTSPLLFASGQVPLSYFCKWSFTPNEEKAAFQWLVEQIMSRYKKDPAMHIFHFGHYEPTHLKSLMGRYVTCEDQVDAMLRAKLFVDLHAVFKRAIRAGTEKYSLKELESLCEFKRQVPLDQSKSAMRFIEHQIELSSGRDIPEKFLTDLQGYNEDDCRSTAALRDFLETQRSRAEEQNGTHIPRRPLENPDASKEVEAQQERVGRLVHELTDELPTDPTARSQEQSARWLLAQLLDMHRRENKVAFWERFRLEVLEENELLDEPKGLAGLKHILRVKAEKIPIDRYSFSAQEVQIRPGDELYIRTERVGSVEGIDVAHGTVDIKKSKKTADLHPTCLYARDPIYKTARQADSLFRLGEWVRDNPIDAPGQYRAARDLLLRKPPRFSDATTLPLLETDALKASIKILSSLDQGVFAIQGPPGAGKTYTAARLICQLVQRGKKVAICAFTHRVIRTLLEEVVTAATEDGIEGVLCLDRDNDGEPGPGVPVAEDDNEAWDALRTGTANVIGGTSWVWSPENAADKLDYLFIDEAGQMALGDVLAVAQTAKNLVLIGDPQQLERPLRGSHPPGAEKSALQHLLGDHKTIPADLGLLLPYTHRLHPKICEFTSQVFYEGKLRPDQTAKNTSFEGHPWLSAGLWFVPVTHDGNCNCSPEEVEVVAKIVESLFDPKVRWHRSIGNPEPMSWKELRIIAPYNVQVYDLTARMPQAPLGTIGTVDKFQGQQAAVVIYSLTTSTQQDIPHGMQFLYSLNRFNVATSRARTCAIVVGNTRLFEPECHTPSQMRLANAFCRFFQMSTHHRLTP